MESNTYTPAVALEKACDTLDLIYSYMRDDYFEGCEQVLPDLLKEAVDLLGVARPGMSPESYADGVKLVKGYRQEIAAW